MLILFHCSIVRRLFLVALPLALSLLFFLPATSEAHAILVRSDPTKGAVLASPPSQVRLWFSEDLNPATSTGQVVNESNQGVSTNVHVLAGEAREIDVNVENNLPPAVYVVIWRTQSADDGHVLSGSFLFTVANPNGSVPVANGTLPGQGNLGGNTGASNGQLDGPALFNLIMVTLVEIGVAFWVGAQLWRSFVLQLIEPESEEQQDILQNVERRFDHVFSLPVLLIIFFANIGLLLGQAITITNGRLDQALPLLGGLATNGQFGTYWLMREIVVVLAIALTVYVLLTKRRVAILTSGMPWMNLLLGLALLIAITLSGHAASVGKDILIYAVLSDWLHLLAAALWVGGIIYIGLVYLPVLKQCSLPQRVQSLVTVLPRYSPLAIAGVLIMALTGPLNATVHMSSWDQLLSTAYGRTVIVKSLLVGGLMVTSAIHVLGMRPQLAKGYKKYQMALDVVQMREETESERLATFTAQQVKMLESRVAQQSRRLISTLQWEPLLGIAVLLCAGLLSVFAGTLTPTTTTQPVPPAQPTPIAPSKPFTTTVKTTDGKYIVNLRVTPNHFGTNSFTASVLNSNGKPDTNVGVSLYTTMLDMDMGTDTVNLQPDGKGNFTASGELSMSGNWEMRVQIRTPDDTLHEARVKFFTPS